MEIKALIEKLKEFDETDEVCIAVSENEYFKTIEDVRNISMKAVYVSEYYPGFIIPKKEKELTNWNHKNVVMIE